MNRYFAILTPSVKRLFYAWISAGFLAIYFVLPLYPNFSGSGSGVAIFYICMQCSVACGLLFPLLMRWRYCQTLRLMPHYNHIIKRLVGALFALFILLPALFAWINNYDIWLVQAFCLLLWSAGGVIILRRLMLNAPSDQQEKMFNSAIFPVFYLPYLISINGGFESLASLSFLVSVEFKITIALLSLLIWLIPKKSYKETGQRKNVSLTTLFLVPNSAKLVFGALSSFGFLGAWAWQLFAASIAILFAYHGQTDMCYVLIFIWVFNLPQWLKQKEKLSTLLFLLNSSERQFGKTVYRSCLAITLYFSLLSALLIWGVSQFMAFEIYFSVLLLSVLLAACVVYLLFCFPANIGIYFGLIAYVLMTTFIESTIEIVPWINIGLAIFIGWTVKYTPNNWLKIDYGLNPLKPTL